MLYLQCEMMQAFNQTFAAPPVLMRSIWIKLVEALENSPVVLINGARQCGKTTLAQMTCAPEYLELYSDSLTELNKIRLERESQYGRNYVYFSFDDPQTRNSAKSDPTGFIDSLPEFVILDEVQHVPELFQAIKISVDRRRTPGRFLLTGSTNVLLLPKLSDSLAGRMQIIQLYPLSQYELVAQPNFLEPGSNFLSALFGDGFPIFQGKRLGEDLAHRVTSGGYPAALARKIAEQRTYWYRDYIQTLIQRDVRDIAHIRSLEVLPKLLSASSAQTAQVFNLSSLAAPLELTRPAIGNYVTILERLFLIEKLPAWHSNNLKHLVKRSKLHINDTGIAATLLDTDAQGLLKDRNLFGRLLESFVYQELRRQASWHKEVTVFSHFRSKGGAETDIVIKLASGEIAGIEIKAGATVGNRDFRGLRYLKRAIGKRFKRGIILYDGENSLPFGDGFNAVPISRLWSNPQASQ